jgi:hypothetical protein
LCGRRKGDYVLRFVYDEVEAMEKEAGKGIWAEKRRRSRGYGNWNRCFYKRFA